MCCDVYITWRVWGYGGTPFFATNYVRLDVWHLSLLKLSFGESQMSCGVIDSTRCCVGQSLLVLDTCKILRCGPEGNCMVILSLAFEGKDTRACLDSQMSSRTFPSRCNPSFATSPLQAFRISLQIWESCGPTATILIYAKIVARTVLRIMYWLCNTCFCSLFSFVGWVLHWGSTPMARH